MTPRDEEVRVALSEDYVGRIARIDAQIAQAHDCPCPAPIKKLKHIALHSDLEATRFTLALGALFCGTGFLWPSNIFPDPAHLTAGARTTYLYMATMMPEMYWGALFVLQGLVMMWSLLWSKRSPILMWADAVLGCALLSVAIISCYAAYWPGWAHVWDYRMPAIMGYELASVLASWWVLARYSYDRRC